MWWWVISITVLVLLAGAVGLAFLARGFSTRKLQRAWGLMEAQPAAALPMFVSIAKSLQTRLEQERKQKQKADPNLAANLQQARVGEALCLLKLTRVDEAIQAEDAARKLGAFPPDYISRLCRAWLAADPVQWPRVGRMDLAEYLGLPESNQNAETREKALSRTLKLLELPADPKQEQIDSVIELGSQVVAGAPGLHDVQYLLGLALHYASRFAEACTCLELAATAAPQDAVRAISLARAQWDAGRKTAARTTYLAVYRLQRDGETAYEVGLACFQTSDAPFGPDDGPEVQGRQPLACAVRFFSEATTKLPDWTDAWLSRAEAELQLGQFEAAQNSLEHVAKIDPDNIQCQAMLGRCRLRSGRLDQARESLSLLEREAPESPGTWRLAAEIAYQDGKYERALPMYRKLAGPAADPELVLQHARCELEVGEHHTARELLQDRPHLDPEARLILGRSQARAGQWTEAQKTLQAETGKVISSEYAYYFANVLGANRRYADAAKLFQQIIDHPQFGARAKRGAAHVAMLSGDYAAAEKHYQDQSDEALRTFDLGRLSVVRGDVEQAEEFFRQCSPPAADKSKSASNRVTARQLRFAKAYVDARLGDPSVVEAFEGDLDSLPYLQEVIAHSEFDAGRFKQALPLFEKSIRQRDSVPTSILARLATGYLHQQRYREALPHLIAVSQRQGNDRVAKENLALCRYHLAREHYRQSMWDAALLEFEAARELFGRLGMPQGAAIADWEAECRFRAGAQCLTSTRLKQPKRATELFLEGTQTRAQEARWWFGLALARAAQEDFSKSADAAAKAVELQRDHVGMALAQGLSLQAAGRSVEARPVFERVLKLLSQQGSSESRVQFLELAARFALGMSYAKDKEWKSAAEALRPLLEHPLLLKPGAKIAPKDVAKAVVAYFALAGQKEQASQLAKKYLKGEAIGDVLIAVVQAEAGDFSGAADTLEKIITPKSGPKMVALLAGCLLSVAAEKVKAGDTAGAEAFVDRALKHAPGNAQAVKLKDALRFAEKFKNFNPKELDQAIQNCRQLVADTNSAQLVRTLGVLLHRKAFQNEQSAASWKECVDFWVKKILGDNKFWKQFLEEYNEGKGKREKVRDEEMVQWRGALPEDLAKEHVDLAVEAIKSRNKGLASRHLEMIWKWKPDYKFELNQLQVALGQTLDETLTRFLTSLLSETSDASVKKFLEPVAGLQYLEKALEHRQRMTAAWERVKALLEDVNRGNTWAAAQVRTYLSTARDEARQARDWAEKAKKASPGETTISDFYNVCRNDYDELSAVCRQIGV